VFPVRYKQKYRSYLRWIVSRIVIVLLIYHRHKPTDGIKRLGSKRRRVGPRTDLDDVEKRKCKTVPGLLNPTLLVVQPITSRYSHYAIPANCESKWYI
jgi:hypothetical protein